MFDSQEKQFEKSTALDRVLDLVLCPILAFFCWPIFAMDIYDIYTEKHFRSSEVAYRVVSMVDSVKGATLFTPFAEFFFHFVTSTFICSMLLTEASSIWFLVGLNYFVANLVCYAEVVLIKFLLKERGLEKQMHYVRDLADHNVN